LCDVTNPMPRVVTAVRRFTDVEAYGFCNASHEGARGYEWLADLVGRSHDQVEVVTAGLNHFSWLISIRDRATGQDLLPAVEQAVRAGEGYAFEMRRRWLDEYGAVAAPGPGHVKDFVAPDPDVRYGTRPPFHGDAGQREERMRKLQDIAAGRLDWRTSLEGKSWEHPVELAVALERGERLDLPMLNLPNQGCLPDLPDERIVEVPAVVEDGAVRGVPVGSLPGSLGELCRLVSDVHELVAEGAATGDRRALERAIEVDPAIPDKAAALAVLDEMLWAHRDLLPRFG
jgi:alpha-galactosidase